MNSFSAWQQSNSSLPYNSSHSVPAQRFITIPDESSTVTVKNITGYPENIQGSLEEIRHRDYIKKRQDTGNRAYSSYVPSVSFGPNSLTPPRYNSNSARNFQNPDPQKPWSLDLQSGQNRNAFGPAPNPQNHPFATSTGMGNNTSFAPNSFTSGMGNHNVFGQASNNSSSGMGNMSFAPASNGFSSGLANNNGFGQGFSTGMANSNGFGQGFSAGIGSTGNFGSTSNYNFGAPTTTNFGGSTGSNFGGSTGSNFGGPSNFGGTSVGQNNPFASTGQNAFTSASNYTGGINSYSNLNPFGQSSGNYSTGSVTRLQDSRAGGFNSGQVGFYAQNNSLQTSNPLQNSFPSSNQTQLNPFNSNSNFFTNPSKPNFTPMMPNPFNSTPTGQSNFGAPPQGNFGAFPYSSGSQNSVFPNNSWSGNAYTHSTQSNGDPFAGENQSYIQNGGRSNAAEIIGAFSDPHGLTWVYPGENPVNLLKNYNIIQAAPPDGVFQRITKRKTQLGTNDSLKDKFTDKPVESAIKKKFRATRIYYKDTRSEKFQFKVREKFKEITYEECVDDGIRFFKVKDHTEAAGECIDILICIEDRDFTKLNINVETNILISELKVSVSQHLPDDKDFDVFHGSKKLKGSESLKSLGIKNGEELRIRFKVTLEESLPKISHFNPTPSFDQMSKMTIEELRAVKNFTLENSFGRITFESPTDLIGLNVDKCISIQEREIIGFPGVESNLKHLEDQRLNKPAVVTLFNFKGGKDKGKLEIKLRICCEENGSEFISCDPISGEFVFRIKTL